MTLIVSVRIKHVYGQRTIYPENDLAKALCDLLETKTFTQRAIDKLKAMGYEFVTVYESV